jgi:hypothetical protein
MIKNYGQVVVRANHFRSRAKEPVSMTQGICGPTFFASSVPEGPLSCVESRLRERLATVGSTEFNLIWKAKTTPAGHLISRLAPSMRLTSEIEFTGSQKTVWSTPRASDGEKGGPNQSFGAGGQPLPSQMHQAAVWSTPMARDSKGSPHTVETMATNSRPLNEQMSVTARMDHGGQEPSGSGATTEKRGVPNPAFPCWLMGYPAEWLCGEALATPSTRSSRRKSSARTWIQSDSNNPAEQNTNLDCAIPSVADVSLTDDLIESPMNQTPATSADAAAVDHSSRGHAKLSASGAKRWIHCPGSIRMSEGLPDNDSEASREGTAVHELGNMALEARLPADHWLGETVHDFVMTQKRCDSCQVYLDTCAEYMDGDWEYWVERNFSLEKLNPPLVPILDDFGDVVGHEPMQMFGTSDFTAINRRLRKAAVVDYKNGFLYVDVSGNEQLRYYALGALYSFDEFPQVDEIEIIIVQPNSTGEDVKRETFSVIDLIEWSLDLMDHAKATLEPDAPLHAGDWCTFCKASGRCPEQVRAAGEAAALDFDAMIDTDPSKDIVVPTNLLLLTEEQLGFLVAYRLPRLMEFAKAAEEAAHAMMNRGVEIPHLKLVPKRATESWVDEATVIDNLKDSFGLPDDKVYAKPEPVSPAQARGNLKDVIYTAKKAAGIKITKKAAEEEARGLLAHLIKKESSGNHVAPIEDKRMAVLPSVYDDFDAQAAPQENEAA